MGPEINNALGLNPLGPLFILCADYHLPFINLLLTTFVVELLH
jgi:hypothetical protein